MILDWKRPKKRRNFSKRPLATNVRAEDCRKNNYNIFLLWLQTQMSKNLLSLKVMLRAVLVLPKEVQSISRVKVNFIIAQWITILLNLWRHSDKWPILIKIITILNQLKMLPKYKRQKDQEDINLLTLDFHQSHWIPKHAWTWSHTG